MRQNKKLFFIISVLLLLIAAVVLVKAEVFFKRNLSEKPHVLEFLNQYLSPTPEPISTPVSFSISLISGPKEIFEDETATFTWAVNGLPATIKTTSVYFGPKSIPDLLVTGISPDNTEYSDYVKEFIDGQYKIPLTFVGNAANFLPGFYFYRSYANINGRHFWSEEKTFTVKRVLENEIKVVDFPEKVRLHENAAFTWEISGPKNKTSYTVIAGGKESKGGRLASAIDIQATPYKVLVSEFIHIENDVPLRFIGNTAFSQAGIFYFRALAVINNKNIWSDEYSLTVE